MLQTLHSCLELYDEKRKSYQQWCNMLTIKLLQRGSKRFYGFFNVNKF